MPDPTPGEIAYAAYWRTMYPDCAEAAALAFAALRPEQHTAWEAAAEAVQAREEDDREAQRRGQAGPPHTGTIHTKELSDPLRLPVRPCEEDTL